MQGAIQNLWPTPIYENLAQGNEYDNIQEELNTTIKRLNFSQYGDWKTSINPNTLELSDDPFNNNILDQYNCFNFLNFLDRCIEEYLCLIDAKKTSYKIDSSWITKTHKGQNAQAHSHGLSDISGVYYVNTNGEDGNLRFEYIHHLLESNYIYSAVGSTPMDRVRAPLYNGLILLWPSNVRHGTEVNTTDHERLSLSFNINLSRDNLR